MIYLIGAGMGSDDNITVEGQNAVDSCSVIIGSERAVKKYKGKKEVLVSYNAEEIKRYLKENAEGKNIAVLFSGDISLCSGMKNLSEKLKEYNVKAIPGISSLSYFCARLGISAEQIKIVSLHGKEANIIGHIKRNRYVFSLLGSDEDLKKICGKLCLYGMGNITINIGERLSYEDEKITKGKASDFTDKKIDKLSVIIAENKDYRNYSLCIADDEFIREDIPMTKSEIREITIGKMKLKEDSVIYDIGSGTGSVSVECALRAVDGKVYAIEKNDKALDLTEKNKIKFGADNIEIIKGTAPEILDSLPSPDCVFIGGSGGKIYEITKKIKEKNKNAVIVINAVSLNTLAQVTELSDKMGYNTDIIQIHASRGKKTGNNYIMTGLNPVYIITLTE